MLRGDPAVGLGKPQRLGHNLSGFWSRRLSQNDRLIYKYDDQRIYVFAIGGITSEEPHTISIMPVTSAEGG